MTEFHPTQFGKYLLLDRIGTGGMAELYRAKITGAQGFEKLIAIKKILPHLSSEERLVGAFIDEAKLAAFLHHQNIIQIYDFGCMEGTYFIAMEYLFGKDLKNITDKSRRENLELSLENALYLVSKVCAGLDYAHKLKDFHGKPLNIIHRDVGPQNIFVTYEGQVKVIDFGIAKAASQNTKTLTGAIKGKVAYMSPEQAEGREINHQSDIFSIGIMFYELVTQRRMFNGDTFQVFSKIREAKFEPPEKIRTDLPPGVSDIICKCLEKDPSNRYQTCGEMLNDLESCISELSLHPTPVGLSQYMKLLFLKEADLEEQSMREVALVDASGTLSALEHVSKQDDGFEKTATTLSGAFKKRKNRFMSLQLVIFFIVAGVSVGSWYLKSHTYFFQKISKGSFSQLFSSSGKQGTWVPQILPKDEAKASDVSKGVGDDPKLAETRSMEKGRALLSDGKFREAAELFENLKKKEPANADRISKLYIQTMNNWALELASKEPEKAMQLLKKSIRLDPENAAGHFQLGLLYTKKKEYKRAIASYKKAADLDYRLPDIYFNLGYVYAVRKDYKKAEGMYRQVIDKSPSFMDEALFNLAMVQVKLGKRNLGIRNLEKAIKVNPGNNLAKRYLKKLKKNKK